MAPHVHGRADPAHFTPFPKNPAICRFLLQLGRYEQAGSGIYNVTRFLPHYSHGAKPRFEEYPDLFVTTIPLAREGWFTHADSQVCEQVAKILDFCRIEQGKADILAHLGLAVV